MHTGLPRRHLLVILLIALVGRLLLLASNSVTFHADEAIVGLMARHILLGERPTFFYGQAYMGSLDAWLIAAGFRLLGDSVSTIRIVQTALYLLVVATGYAVVWRWSQRAVIAAVAGLALAVPTVNMALYTTATLGGYNETLLLGNIMLLLGYDVTHEHRSSGWRWAALGLAAGVGWWTNGLIVAYALPMGLLVLNSEGKRTPRMASLRQIAPKVLVALVGFAVGSAPWWWFDITHNGAAISTFLRTQQVGEFTGIGITYVPPLQRAIGLLVIGLPTLIGMRFPWLPSYFLLPLGIAVLLVYGVAVFRLLRRHNPLLPEARGLVLGIPALFMIIFVASSFGADPTGRYFLPLALPLGVLLGTLVANSPLPNPSPCTGRGFHRQMSRLLPFAAVALVVGYQAAGQVTAVTTNPPGLTTQFDLISHIPNDHDAELLAFLDEHQLLNGYTNYWVAFRLAFLSGEQMQYSAALPYKADMSYNSADNRYKPYAAATEQAERVAFITTNLPELDARLETLFNEQGLTYQQAQIGLFHIYYDFEPGRSEFTSWASLNP